MKELEEIEKKIDFSQVKEEKKEYLFDKLLKLLKSQIKPIITSLIQFGIILFFLKLALDRGGINGVIILGFGWVIYSFRLLSKQLEAMYKDYCDNSWKH